MFGVFSAPPGPPVEGNEGKWGGTRRDTGGTPQGHRRDISVSPPCPAHVPPCPAHVPPCPAHVPPCPAHVPPCPAQVPPCPAQVPPCPAQVPPCPAHVPPCPALFQCQSCAVGTCIQQLPRNPTRLEVQLRFVMHSTFVCSSTFLLLADGMPAKRGRGASPETSCVVQRVDREEETRTAASDRGEASRAERSRTPPPVAARATWRWCWILTIQDGGEEVWWWRW